MFPNDTQSQPDQIFFLPGTARTVSSAGGGSDDVQKQVEFLVDSVLKEQLGSIDLAELRLFAIKVVRIFFATLMQEECFVFGCDFWHGSVRVESPGAA